MSKKNYLLVFFVYGAIAMSAQNSGVSVNSNGAPPDPSAMLDVSSTTKGTLITRMTTAQRNAIFDPATGLQIYNTTTNCINIWTGSSWKQVCGDCDFTTPIAGNNGPLCEGSTLNLTATSVEGATYHWTGPNAFSSTEQNPSISNAGASASGTYSVTATLNGCTTQPQSTVATVNATPITPVAGANSPVCAGNTLVFTATPIVGAIYSWTGPDSFTSNLQNPAISNSQEIHEGNYNVTATVNGCTSSVGSVSTVVNPIPSSTFSPLTAKINYPKTFSPVTSGAVYNWTFASGSPSSSTFETPSVTWSNTGDYAVSLTVTLNGCSSTTTTTVSVLPLTTQTYNYSGNIETFTIPGDVTSMVVEVWGAQGGSTSYGTGGKGAYIKGTIAVIPGQNLKILVGKQGVGNSDGAGGGGGSFVTLSDNTPLVIAGGGGGAGGYNQSSPASVQWGVDGTTNYCGTNSVPSSGQYYIADGQGGCDGNGGTGGQSHRPGGGGGGLYTNGSAYTAQYGGGDYGRGGNAFANGGQAGLGEGNDSNRAGGFGGGGGGALGGGGGGGYSGGGGGTWSGYSSSDWGHGGGAGGSFNAGTDQTNTSGIKTGNGQIIFTY